MSEPPITVRAAHYSMPPNEPVERIVIHATSPTMGGHDASAPGMAHSTALYFERGAPGSAHYVVDAGEYEEHCVPDTSPAWHAPPNTGSIGIEICGESTYTRADWLASDVYPAIVAAARRTAELCERFDVPVALVDALDLQSGCEGITSHAEVAKAFGESDHWDPGTAFPWDIFEQLVLAARGGWEGIEVHWYDVADEVCVDAAAGVWYQLQRDGGVRVVDDNREPLDGARFHEYAALANTGQIYKFGPDLNAGVFSYPGLPDAARQGYRYFVRIWAVDAFGLTDGH